MLEGWCTTCLLALVLVGQSRPSEPPHAAVVWAVDALEVVAAFDQPLDPKTPGSLVGQAISYDDLQGQAKSSPRKLRIAAARLEDDGHTLILVTDPHPRNTLYHPPIPGAGSYSLSGVQADWGEPDDLPENPRWSLWLPTLDLDEALRDVKRSRRHASLRERLARPGRLTLATLVTLPVGQATLHLETTGSIEDALLGDTQADPITDGKTPRHALDLAAESRGEPLYLSITIKTGATKTPFDLHASLSQKGAPTQAISANQLLLPWAPARGTTSSPPATTPTLEGGDADRGRTLFFGDQAKCSQCHAHGGKGGAVGPDLTRPRVLDRAWIYQSIATPSAQIEPEFTTYTVALKDGQVHSGVVRALDAASIQVVDSNAHPAVIKRDQIVRLQPSATSIMPVGLAAALGDPAIRDLIAFLMAR